MKNLTALHKQSQTEYYKAYHQAGPEIPLPIKAITLTTIIIATTIVTTIIAATAK